MKKYLKTDEWNIIEDQFHPDRQRMSESIFSLGNGRFGQRGYFEEPYSSDSYRGSFVAGITFHARYLIMRKWEAAPDRVQIPRSLRMC